MKDPQISCHDLRAAKICLSSIVTSRTQETSVVWNISVHEKELQNTIVITIEDDEI